MMMSRTRDVYWMIVSALLTLGLLTLPAHAVKNENPTPTPKPGTASDVKAKAAQTMEASQLYASKQKNEYEGEMKASIAKLDLQIKTLKDKASAQGKKAHGELDEQVRKIESERKALADRFGELQRSSDKAWKDVRKGVDSAWDELRKSVKSASDRFSTTKPESKASSK